MYHLDICGFFVPVLKRVDTGKEVVCVAKISDLNIVFLTVHPKTCAYVP